MLNLTMTTWWLEGLFLWRLPSSGERESDWSDAPNRPCAHCYYCTCSSNIFTFCI